VDDKIAEIKRHQAEIQATLDRNREALRTARERSARTEATLAWADAELRTARWELRRLGLLKR
jgi:hypothetical protein